MQQSSATQSLHLSFWGLRKIVACSHSSSQCLLVSTVFGTVSSLHPTSFLMIFTLVYIQKPNRGYKTEGNWGGNENSISYEVALSDNYTREEYK